MSINIQGQIILKGVWISYADNVKSAICAETVV